MHDTIKGKFLCTSLIGRCFVPKIYSLWDQWPFFDTPSDLQIYCFYFILFYSLQALPFLNTPYHWGIWNNRYDQKDRGKDTIETIPSPYSLIKARNTFFGSLLYFSCMFWKRYIWVHSDSEVITRGTLFNFTVYNFSYGPGYYL